MVISRHELIYTVQFIFTRVLFIFIRSIKLDLKELVLKNNLKVGTYKKEYSVKKKNEYN